MVVVRDFFLKAIAQGREVSEPFEREAFLDCSRDEALQDANMGIDELWIRAKYGLDLHLRRRQSGLREDFRGPGL